VWNPDQEFIIAVKNQYLVRFLRRAQRAAPPSTDLNYIKEQLTDLRASDKCEVKPTRFSAHPQIVLALSLLLTAASGCYDFNGMPAGSMGGTIGPGLPWTDKQFSNSHRGHLTLPMNFSLVFDSQQDIRPYAPKVSREDANRFLSIGMRTIEQDYLIDFPNWPITVLAVCPDSTSKSGLEHDESGGRCRITSKATSRWSNPFSLSNTNKFTNLIVQSDPDRDDQYEYRCAIAFVVEAEIPDYRPNSVNFACTLDLEVGRKSKFLDDDPKNWKPVQKFTPDAGNAIATFLSKDIFAAYFQYFQEQGIKVVDRSVK
jgi:hypothetical protein